MFRAAPNSSHRWKRQAFFGVLVKLSRSGTDRDRGLIADPVSGKIFRDYPDVEMSRRAALLSRLRNAAT